MIEQLKAAFPTVEWHECRRFATGNDQGIWIDAWVDGDSCFAEASNLYDATGSGTAPTLVGAVRAALQDIARNLREQALRYEQACGQWGQP